MGSCSDLLGSITIRLKRDRMAVDPIAAANAKKVLRDNLTSIAPAFAQMPYFMSEEYSLVDCCMAPLMLRLNEYGIKLPMSGKPLQQYADRLFEREAFKTSLSGIESEYNDNAA